MLIDAVITENAESEGFLGTVDIGGGVLIEKGYLDQLVHACASGPGKFARALLRHVFTPEELKGKTLFGGKGKAQGDTPTKPGLDPVRVKAVVGECT
ncbi:hypothetical protein HPB48_026662 [Haemaphysalis longicornis]|uniref:BEN domain-containing protein n=1 Tax=Haemaphysalis longicornis TaxID=44386 RepID=A0A9J6HBA3_HAELO|nr:hypothetical protein HPB48_026662 [Haemaphysalis longicornis]